MRPVYISDALLEAAELAARRLEEEARSIRDAAKARAQIVYRDQAIANADRAAGLVADLVEDGVTPAQAINEVAERLGIDAAFVEDMVKRSNRAAVVVDRWERDRRIIELARTMTNVEIAQLEGVSESVVTRTIKQAYRTAAHAQTRFRGPTRRPGCA